MELYSVLRYVGDGEPLRRQIMELRESVSVKADLV